MAFDYTSLLTNRVMVGRAGRNSRQFLIAVISKRNEF